MYLLDNPYCLRDSVLVYRLSYKHQSKSQLTQINTYKLKCTWI